MICTISSHSVACVAFLDGLSWRTKVFNLDEGQLTCFVFGSVLLVLSSKKLLPNPRAHRFMFSRKNFSACI